MTQLIPTVKPSSAQLAYHARPNETQAQDDLQDAIDLFGAGSQAAEAARRHLALVQRFNALYMETGIGATVRED